MVDTALEVLKSYDFTVKKTNKIRGGILCDTDLGPKVIRLWNGTAARLEYQNQLLGRMEELGPVRVDLIVPNREQELMTKVSDGSCYVVRNWYMGREMDIRQGRDVCLLANTLAQIHILFDRIGLMPPGEQKEKSMEEEYGGYIREMRRTRRYLNKKHHKQQFEILLSQAYPAKLAQADSSFHEIRQAEEILRKTRKERSLRHGSYSYHNVCVSGKDTVVFQCGMARGEEQIRDLYDLLRKVMEKNDWDSDMGRRVLEGYDIFRPISQGEMAMLRAQLRFPYKYWKLMNHYLNSGKAWMPERNMAKLEKIYRQEKQKQLFIEKMF